MGGGIVLCAFFFCRPRTPVPAEGELGLNVHDGLLQLRRLGRQCLHITLLGRLEWGMRQVTL